jgi:hypothetical protein
MTASKSNDNDPARSAILGNARVGGHWLLVKPMFRVGRRTRDTQYRQQSYAHIETWIARQGRTNSQSNTVISG